jgi:adenosylcobinamide-GDP ribazoletransferase
VSAFFAAVQFLTIFPWPKSRDYSADELGRAAILFPVIGFLLGIILVLVNASLEPFASAGLLSVALVAMLALLTGGLHLDGLGDSFDGLGASGDRERMLRIMDDSRTGAFGLIAVVLLLFFKVHSLESIETDRWRALLAAPVLGRWAMVLLGYRSHAAKPGLGSSFVEHLKTKHVILSTFITLLLVASVLRGMGVALMIWVAVFSTVNRMFWQRRLGGVTGDTFGAVGELSEAFVFVILALGYR